MGSGRRCCSVLDGGTFCDCLHQKRIEVSPSRFLRRVFCVRMSGGLEKMGTCYSVFTYGVGLLGDARYETSHRVL